MKKIQTAMEFLPADVWSHIFSSLDADLESLSLVCKHLLSITNSFNQTLKLSHESAPFLPSLLRRFSSIKHLSLSDFQALDPNPVLLQLADFPIRLETLNLSGLSRLPLQALHRLPASVLTGVKCLDISRICGLRDDDLNTIPVLFPALDELDLSLPISLYNEGFQRLRDRNVSITDDGIHMLIPKLNAGLRKINLSGHPYISDRHLILLLSENCPNLEEIVVNGSTSMLGIGIVLCSFRKLRSIGFRGWADAKFNYDIPLCCASTSLSKIEFDAVGVHGDLLRAIAEARLPLKSFTLAHNNPINCFDDVASFMNTYDSLEYLDLRGGLYSDVEMATLAKYLTKARVVKLTSCPYLSVLTLFTFIQHCPLLHTFEMDCDKSMGERPDEFKEGSRFSSQIRTLKLFMSWRLTDKDLSRIALACPNLETLELEKCIGISNDGFEEIMGKCHNLKHLLIDGCCKINNRSLGSKTRKLEILGAQ